MYLCIFNYRRNGYITIWFILAVCSCISCFCSHDKCFITIPTTSTLLMKACFCLTDVLSMAKALEDYVASDCRYINLRRGQMIYVFSKLKPAEGAGDFWFGSVRVFIFDISLRWSDCKHRNHSSSFAFAGLRGALCRPDGCDWIFPQ